MIRVAVTALVLVSIGASPLSFSPQVPKLSEPVVVESDEPWSTADFTHSKSSNKHNEGICLDSSPEGWYDERVYTTGIPSGYVSRPSTISACELEQLQEDCVNRINMYRSGELLFRDGSQDSNVEGGLEPYTRRRGSEQCSNAAALGDLVLNYQGGGGCAGGHANAAVCPWRYAAAQNACCGRGDGSFGNPTSFDTYEKVRDELYGCLQDMWDEGHLVGGPKGHWETMRSTRDYEVSCGFGWSEGGRVWMTQDFFVGGEVCEPSCDTCGGGDGCTANECVCEGVGCDQGDAPVCGVCDGSESPDPETACCEDDTPVCGYCDGSLSEDDLGCCPGEQPVCGKCDGTVPDENGNCPWTHFGIGACLTDAGAYGTSGSDYLLMDGPLTREQCQSACLAQDGCLGIEHRTGGTHAGRCEVWMVEPGRTSMDSTDGIVCMEPPASGGSVSVCGNGVVEPGEHCDSGINCNGCQCPSGYLADGLQPPGCTGCGNDQLDSGEICDGGSECQSDCTCPDAYIADSLTPPGCEIDRSNVDPNDASTWIPVDPTTSGACISQTGGWGVQNSDYILIDGQTTLQACGEACMNNEDCVAIEHRDTGELAFRCELWITAPIRSDPGSTKCLEKPEVQNTCGNNELDGMEDCDGGTGCQQDCTCPTDQVGDGLDPPGCTLCGNDQLDNGEDCDGGAECTSCSCPQDYTADGLDPPGCQVVDDCGNNQLDGQEDCDGGALCSQCECPSGAIANGLSPPGCTYCGNDVINDGEDCDGGADCTPQCTCPDGYVGDGLSPPGCTPTCGNDVIDDGEDCDGGAECTSQCTCPDGYVGDGQSPPGCTTSSGGVVWTNVGDGPCLLGERAYGTAGSDYLLVDGQTSLEDCQALCLANDDCVAIEHRDSGSHAFRCELWITMPELSTGGGAQCLYWEQSSGSCSDDELGAMEDCDGGADCTPQCTCPDGYVGDGLSPPGCTPTCGNDVIDDGEDCDGGAECTSQCTCPDGYVGDGQSPPGCTTSSGGIVWTSVDPNAGGPCRNSAGQHGTAGSEYLLVNGQTSLEDCQALCLANDDCVAIEHRDSGSHAFRCELWITMPQFAIGGGAQCLYWEEST